MGKHWNWVEASRDSWGRNMDSEEVPSDIRELVKAGCFQRIASAMERTASALETGTKDNKKLLNMCEKLKSELEERKKIDVEYRNIIAQHRSEIKALKQKNLELKKKLIKAYEKE